jgi:hypothetical protein
MCQNAEEIEKDATMEATTKIWVQNILPFFVNPKFSEVISA